MRRKARLRGEDFEYGAVVQFPVSVDPVATYLPVTAKNEISYASYVYTMTHRTSQHATSMFGKYPVK